MARYWADLTSEEIGRAAAQGAIAVLPVSAIEQHGPHLPVSVDTTIVEGIIAAALPLLPADLPVLFLPTQSIGKSNEHSRYPGTLTFSAEILIRMWMEIGACVAAAGIRKLVILNSHGGQLSVMDIVSRDLRVAHNMLVVTTNTFSLTSISDLFGAGESQHGIHGGDKETSIMLALRPDLVQMGRAKNFRSLTETLVRDYQYLSLAPKGKLAWQIQDMNVDGACGDASLATAEKGRQVVARTAAALVELLAEVHGAPLSWLDNAPAGLR